MILIKDFDQTSLKTRELFRDIWQIACHANILAQSVSLELFCDDRLSNAVDRKFLESGVSKLEYSKKVQNEILNNIGTLTELLDVFSAVSYQSINTLFE